MKASTLEDYYQQAGKRLPQRSAAMVIELVEEVRRLRDLHTKRKARRGEDLDDDCEISFGEYAGERLADVPDDYLVWWRSQNRLDSLTVDASFGQQPAKAIAKQRLRLYEYICKRVGNNGREIQELIGSSQTEVVEDTARETGETSTNA